MAGGGGTRLWPISRQKNPKQIQPLMGEKTLLQRTFSRLRRMFRLQDIIVATNEEQLPLIERQIPNLPRENYSVETVRRDTAPAIGLAVTKIFHTQPQEVFVYINCDNDIQDVPEFLRILKLAERVIQKKPNHVVLIGVNPTYPETGYGYIKMGTPAMRFSRGKKAIADEIFEVEQFIEKPNLETAKKFLKRWEYLWNPTLVVSRSDHFLQLYREFLPRIYRGLVNIEKVMGMPKERQVVNQELVRMKPISVDYGILEKTKKMFVIPADFGWADIGHWRMIKDLLSKTMDENVIKGKHAGMDTRDSLIYSFTPRLIATAGIHSMVIIDTPDVLLVCPKHRSQDVKKIVEALKRRKKYQKYL